MSKGRRYNQQRLDRFRGDRLRTFERCAFCSSLVARDDAYRMKDIGVFCCEGHFLLWREKSFIERAKRK